MEQINENKIPVKEKGSQPRINGKPCVIRTVITYKLRWEAIVVFALMVSIELFAAWKLYTDWNYTFKNIYKTDKHEGTVRMLDVNSLRFHLYMRDFGKVYDSVQEYDRRFENFKASLKEIAILNHLEKNTVFGLTKFSDMSKDEFVERMLPKSRPLPPSCGMMLNCTDSMTPHRLPIMTYNGVKVPSSFDCFAFNVRLSKKIYVYVKDGTPPSHPVPLAGLGRSRQRKLDVALKKCIRRKKNVVKPVLNQRLCQGCWAFSVIGVLESMSAIQLKDYESRSIQQLLDCSTDTEGCDKGNVVTAMRYLCMNKIEVVTEKEYPLDLGIDKNCRTPYPHKPGRRVKAFWHICDMDEDEMVELIATHGPLVVTVDARNWQNYIGGVITRACTRGEGNHVVQIVGYAGYKSLDAKTPIPYYIVRNSYGKDFGEDGYLKIAMKHGDISDVCGIAEGVTIMEALE